VKYQNNKLNIYLPLILALIFAGGIFIGLQLKKTQSTNSYSFRPKIGKLNGILSFIEAEYVDSINRRDLEEAAIPEILEQLDPHSVYIPARDVARVSEPLEGNFEGIGVSFSMPNDTVIINSIIAGGPSEKVGIMAGDRIVKISDSIVAGVSIHQDDIVKKLKGPRGTKVTIGIMRRSVPEILDFTITRDKIPLYSVDVSYLVNDSTGYIKISKFARTTFHEFIEALDKLKQDGMTQLILDLRSNGGGYMDAATNLANQFLEKETLIVYTEGRSQARENFYADGKGKFQDGKILILQDEWSASASEIVAGAIQDNDRGTIMGRRSFGKGLVQEPLMLSDGSLIRLTIARYYTPTGRCIQKPYNNGHADYVHDLESRFLNGEFEKKDSIHFNDSLKYTTPGGKIVYGGGGIMPDIFIPMDTTGVSLYFRELRAKGLIYRYAFEYTDKNRSALEVYKNPEELRSYLETLNLFDKFINFAESNGVPPDKKGINESKFLIHTEILAYIARNILDNAGFYPIWKDIDHTLNEAIKYLSS
jgi:carboxyl-terminal processing protease